MTFDTPSDQQQQRQTDETMVENLSAHLTQTLALNSPQQEEPLYDEAILEYHHHPTSILGVDPDAQFTSQQYPPYHAYYANVNNNLDMMYSQSPPQQQPPPPHYYSPANHSHHSPTPQLQQQQHLEQSSYIISSSSSVSSTSSSPQVGALVESGASTPGTNSSMTVRNTTSTMSPAELRSACTVFVGGISYRADEDMLKGFFDQFGEVIEVKLIRDKYNNNQSKGYVCNFKLQLLIGC